MTNTLNTTAAQAVTNAAVDLLSQRRCRPRCHVVAAINLDAGPSLIWAQTRSAGVDTTRPRFLTALSKFVSQRLDPSGNERFAAVCVIEPEHNKRPTMTTAYNVVVVDADTVRVYRAERQYGRLRRWTLTARTATDNDVAEALAFGYLAQQLNGPELERSV